jgi:hypothetical protein
MALLYRAASATAIAGSPTRRGISITSGVIDRRQRVADSLRIATVHER